MKYSNGNILRIQNMKSDERLEKKNELNFETLLINQKLQSHV